ncbi:MAG: hypothetical protein ACTJG1_12580 [Enterococcus gilvus]
MKKTIHDAVAIGIVCFLASLSSYIAKGELTFATFIYLILPSFFIVTFGSLLLMTLSKK